jgi:hypothetical protein
MPSHSSERNEDLVKIRQRQDSQQSEPRADRGGDANHLLSALGNARVQRLMRSALHRQADGSASVDDDIAKSIQAKRGGGEALDEGVRRNLEPAFGEDFSDVRVHADSEANSLNHEVQAEAFTTGKDIFFREGKYNPGSSDGQKLLAHELTHVVQQRDAPPTSELTVSDPEDASEREAGHVADSFSAQPAGVSRQAEEEEMATSRLDREEMPEEEEMLQGSFLDREEMPEEEEMLQGSFLDRAEPEEEEMLQGSFLDRQEMEDEEELATSRIDREGAEEEMLPT